MMGPDVAFQKVDKIPAGSLNGTTKAELFESEDMILSPTNQAERTRPASEASRSKILLKPLVRPPVS
jgi:hypothetical protein